MLKKPALFFACMLLAAMAQLSANDHSYEAFTGAVLGSKVRMRTQPNLEAHVVRETANGELFAIDGEVNEYYSIVPPKGTKGYVFRTFILEGTVEGERVNVRLYPDMDAPVVGQLNRGDKVTASVSDINNKWLEIELPHSSHFYIAKEYIENRGPADLVVKVEKKRIEAAHLLSSAYLFAQAELQKPFEQIDFDRIKDKFAQISNTYLDLPEVHEKAKEVAEIIQDVYVQKKVAFLGGKIDRRSAASEISPRHLERLAQLGIEIHPAQEEKNPVEIASAASQTLGMMSTFNDETATDKMRAWQPLEESFYHLWAAMHGEKSFDEFYAEEESDAMTLTGFVEPYNRPVKNLPGDYLLKSDNMPVAFLYSTRINLEKYVGKKVTVVAAPRPNHNFAFPAYFVINVE